MSLLFDPHANFATSLVATAPSPASSGLSLVVTGGGGAAFPSVPFNAVVYPAGQLPLSSNAEIIRVTTVATDTFTIVRQQEGTSARSIIVGDVISAVITKKMVTDMEATAGTLPVNFRLTGTTGVPVTTSDVTAITSIKFTPYGGNRIALFDSNGNPTIYTSGEMSLAVPNTTSTMYDVFCFNSSNTPTLEALAWANDTTRATTVINTAVPGVYTKNGDMTRRYVGSFRTTGVSGQTEDSAAKRYIWNYYNRVTRFLQRQDATASWNYTTATIRQANANTANQVDIVVGIAEVLLDLSLNVAVSNSNAGGVSIQTGIAEDSTTAFNINAALSMVVTVATNAIIPMHTRAVKYPAIGRHFYSWNEISVAAGTTTFYSNFNAVVSSNNAHGLTGRFEG